MNRHKLIWLLAAAMMLGGLAGCYAPALTSGGETSIPPAPSAVVEAATEPVTQAPTLTAAPAVTVTAMTPTLTTLAPTETPSLTAATITPAATRTFTAATIAPAATQEETVTKGDLIPAPYDPTLQKLVTGAQEDLAGRLGIASREVEVVEVRSVVWPDGGLGCPEPGVAYTQVQVDGLLIRLQAGGRVYEYHSGPRRPPFLCQQ